MDDEDSFIDLNGNFMGISCFMVMIGWFMDDETPYHSNLIAGNNGDDWMMDD